jgi:hypothetical protein
LSTLPNPEVREMGPTAPVLYISRVFDAAFCRELIETYETMGNVESGVMRGGVPDSGKNFIDYDTKIRSDHLVKAPALMNRVARHLQVRVMPEIQKAFQFRITRFPGLKIVCYKADEDGFFRPHRDDTSARSSYRRFALTVNLNTGEYEGGHLRFPEYGPHLYRPAAGDAIVFSCSLVHEVIPVSAGNRFALITFFYGEDSAELPMDQLV